MSLCASLVLDTACTSRNPRLEVDSAKLRIFKALPPVMDTADDLNTCGVDNQPVSDGHKGQLGTRDQPTVWRRGTLYSSGTTAHTPSRSRPRDRS